MYRNNSFHKLTDSIKCDKLRFMRQNISVRMFKMKYKVCDCKQQPKETFECNINGKHRTEACHQDQVHTYDTQQETSFPNKQNQQYLQMPSKLEGMKIKQTRNLSAMQLEHTSQIQLKQPVLSLHIIKYGQVKKQSLTFKNSLPTMTDRIHRQMCSKRPQIYS